MHQQIVSQVNSDSSQLPHQVDDALTSIRAIRAQHRAEVIANGLRLVDPVSPALRAQIERNLLERMQIFAAITASRQGPLPEGWAEDFVTRTLTMVYALSRGTR